MSFEITRHLEVPTFKIEHLKFFRLYVALG